MRHPAEGDRNSARSSLLGAELSKNACLPHASWNDTSVRGCNRQLDSPVFMYAAGAILAHYEPMALFELTRTLVDINSVTGSEQACAEFLRGHLAERGYEVELQPVSDGRANVFARHGPPEIVLSTHMDTVPPFVPSREDTEFIYGRGSCDAKGILRVDIRARGRTAPSAYPHLGESAIEKLLDILNDLRRLPLPRDATLGDATVNIGVISGGTAANVIPGEARAEVLFRTVDDGRALREAVEGALRDRCEYEFVRQTPAMRMEKLNGFESSVVAFTTDLPNLTAWGRPLLVGPGSIAVAHTDHECIRKSDLVAAVELYVRLVRELEHRP